MPEQRDEFRQSTEWRWQELSPLASRYVAQGSRLHKLLAPYLSAESNIRYCLSVEAAFARALGKQGIIPAQAVREIIRACALVTAADVDAFERTHGHQTIALVEAIRFVVNDQAKPYVHLFATSSDIQDTALALRLRDLCTDVLIPLISELTISLCALCIEHSETLQIGRTHGQHAQPITFGFSLALFVDRLGNRLERIAESVKRLHGTFSGPVGAFNSLSLFCEDATIIEHDALRELGIETETISSQIVQPEALLDLACAVVSCVGVLANLADDWRHLTRTEIDEMKIEFRGMDKGSSAMPHKNNPWVLEHVKSLWKVAHAMVSIPFSDQISEHQRDLTNSASKRFVEELFTICACAIDSASEAVRGVKVNREQMLKNLHCAGDQAYSEPVKIALALLGDPDPDYTVRELLRSGREAGDGLLEALRLSEEGRCKQAATHPVIVRLSTGNDSFIGRSQEITQAVCEKWLPVLESHLQSGAT